jgi:hypothetical protein
VGLALFERKISLQLDDPVEGEGEKLSITVQTGKFSRLNVFELKEPRRMVIDLYGKTPQRSREYLTPKSSALERVRIGSHPDRLRIVADYRDKFARSAEWHIVSNILEVEFPQETQKSAKANSTFGVISTDQPEYLEPTVVSATSVTTGDDLASAPALLPTVPEPHLPSFPVTQSATMPHEAEPVRSETAQAPSPTTPAIKPVVLTARRVLQQRPATIAPEPQLPLYEEDVELLALPQLESVIPPSPEKIAAAAALLPDLETPPADDLIVESDLTPSPQIVTAMDVETTDSTPRDSTEKKEGIKAPPTTLLAEPTSSEEPRMALRMPAQEVTAAPEVLGQQLSAIEFHYHTKDKTPLLKFVLSERPVFTLVKNSNSRYTVSIPDCTLGKDYLSLPHFPPHNFRGFQMISAKSRKGKTEITISVDKGATLISYVRDTSIFLRADSPS